MPVKIENLSFTYAPKTPFQYEAIKNINLTIEDHAFVAIVGPTGSGKSTLVQHINALLLPNEGMISVNGNIIRAKEKVKNVKRFRQETGLVFQFPEYQLFEETVLKDVAFGPRNFGVKEEEAKEKAKKALTQVGIGESYYEKSPFELSGGEKRRVAIAGIIAMEPKILVLDEPTAGLDPRGAKEMMFLFKELHNLGTTIILVTHDMNIVLEYAERVIVLKEGRIVEDTTSEKLFAAGYKDYHLEIPPLYEFANLLKTKGMKINIEKIRNLSDLLGELQK